ncbi:hypothetical protein IZY60_13415 [Lutibacter sp. B2]|nr:hypothetical protein [Lutibacter sp. B2]
MNEENKITLFKIIHILQFAILLILVISSFWFGPILGKELDTIVIYCGIGWIGLLWSISPKLSQQAINSVISSKKITDSDSDIIWRRIIGIGFTILSIFQLKQYL